MPTQVHRRLPFHVAVSSDFPREAELSHLRRRLAVSDARGLLLLWISSVVFG